MRLEAHREDAQRIRRPDHGGDGVRQRSSIGEAVADAVQGDRRGLQPRAAQDPAVDGPAGGEPSELEGRRPGGAGLVDEHQTQLARSEAARVDHDLRIGTGRCERTVPEVAREEPVHEVVGVRRVVGNGGVVARQEPRVPSAAPSVEPEPERCSVVARVDHRTQHLRHDQRGRQLGGVVAHRVRDVELAHVVLDLARAAARAALDEGIEVSLVLGDLIDQVEQVLLGEVVLQVVSDPVEVVVGVDEVDAPSGARMGEDLRGPGHLGRITHVAVDADVDAGIHGLHRVVEGVVLRPVDGSVRHLVAHGPEPVDLVADLPVLHAEGLGVAVRGSLRGPVDPAARVRAVDGRVAVLDPVSGQRDGLAELPVGRGRVVLVIAVVDRQQRLRPETLTEAEELEGVDRPGIALIVPALGDGVGRVVPIPVVGVGGIAAGEAQEPGSQGLQSVLQGPAERVVVARPQREVVAEEGRREQPGHAARLHLDDDCGPAGGGQGGSRGDGRRRAPQLEVLEEGRRLRRRARTRQLRRSRAGESGQEGHL